ncbi:F-box/WD repeat-containing protein 10-like isoform X3 [Crotalus tigris]|uniref:F-box/WD repeat-containing protein 10-like isoform X3 n=1 Tax=Crotalus tigris TaxID=88082 RepID=UPI00192F65E0|nr:F-box/WD repeat-containing protein 10-like isoform X3 [Crotalus tigris]
MLQMYNTMSNVMKFLPGPHKRVVLVLFLLSKEQNSKIICMEDLVMTVFELLIAGTESTSNAIAYGIILLASFPKVQAKIQQEIGEVVGQNCQPSMEDKIKLTYTNAFAHEMLRFQPGSSENFPRTATQNVIFKGHFIPQGYSNSTLQHMQIGSLNLNCQSEDMTKVIKFHNIQGTTVLPLWASVHFDPLCWENPKTFDPSHFLDKNGDFLKKDAYLPFSAEEEYVKQSKYDMRPLVPMKSTTVSQMAENQFLSKASSVFGNIRVHKIWSKQSESIFKKALCDLENETNYFSMLTLHPITAPAFPQQSPNKFRDFIRYLPVHLSKSILRMLDMKTLARCASVNPHWNFLVKQLKCDVVANYALRSQISFFQALCPKGAISTFARIVKVAIPRITSNGDIILTKTKKQFKDYDQQQTTSQSEDTEYMQKAYHGQETDTVKLEERNVFCSAYNVRVLINSLDSNRVIHSTSGRLLAFGSLDRKIRFLDIEKIKIIPPVFSGHAGSIRTLYLNEERGFLLSGSYDLSIRLWNIRKGTCVKIFLGHKGNLTCLDVCKTRFVSGSKDCTAKLWDMKTGRCIKTFTHKGYIWAAKMNDIHIVSSCEKGLVKIWHAESYVLIKVLEGHRGPVKCLSFDEWHLVTGSSDRYILAWSMLGKHKRCLMAFRHPQEVLSLAFVYLRVISGCADGKIRIFNFFSGICLRVMRANSRGDPVVSFCILENRLLINAEGSVVLFQFEEVEWDHNQPSDRIPNQTLTSKFHDIPTQIKPSPFSKSMREKRARKKNWKLYREDDDTVLSYYISQHATRLSKGVPALLYEIVKTPLPRKREGKTAMILDPYQKQRLSELAHQTLKEQRSSTIIKVTSDEELVSEAPAPSSFAQNTKALLNHIKKRHPIGPISNDQILLTVSTVHHAYQNDDVNANMAYNMNINDAWEPVQPKKELPRSSLSTQSSKYKAIDLATQVKQLKAAGGTLGMEKISSPYETKILQLNTKNSLLGGNVKSFIPPPSITRSKSCSSLSRKKAYFKISSAAAAESNIIGGFTSSVESIKIPRMKIAQPDTNVTSRRRKFFHALNVNPYRYNSGFQLLTTQQMKEYEEAKIAEYQATKTKVIANREKVCKNAWVRKIKGLPIDDFTKEGRTAAPELGDNVFI